MNTLLMLTTLLFGQRRAPPPARAALMPLPELIDDDAQAPAGCGWFDSSHTLQQGLQVTEHGAADAVCAALPLEGWLELQLTGWRPALQHRV
ncbi:MAG: hypothetical protein Q8N44_04610 [Rubrivivax sp.]|nr:hypothetical protein [Rubrivivax sp.]MDP3082960.1 hypothetical protein [Rubrivivax sp.]